MNANVPLNKLMAVRLNPIKIALIAFHWTETKETNCAATKNILLSICVRDRMMSAHSFFSVSLCNLDLVFFLRLFRWNSLKLMLSITNWRHYSAKINCNNNRVNQPVHDWNQSTKLFKASFFLLRWTEFTRNAEKNLWHDNNNQKKEWKSKTYRCFWAEFFGIFHSHLNIRSRIAIFPRILHQYSCNVDALCIDNHDRSSTNFLLSENK